MNRTATLLLLSLACSQCMPFQQARKDAAAARAGAIATVNKERGEGREQERSAYDDGMSDGVLDADRGAAGNYLAHRGRFNPHTEQAYRDGYRGGYGKSRPGTHEATLTTAQQAARDEGYAAGLRDRRMNRGADADSHNGTYDAKFSSWFLDGYQEGFEGR